MIYNRKITPELIPRVCDRIVQGERIRAVAKAVGVGRSTIFYWLSRGESSRSGIYRQFFKQYHRAKNAYAARVIETVIGATQARTKEKSIAEKLNITPRTWQNWRVRGEGETSGFYSDLVKAIDATRLEEYQVRVNELEQEAKSLTPVTVSEAWRLLARFNPDVWGER